MSEWIPVTERLPIADTTVQVRYGERQSVGSLREDGQGKKWLQTLDSSETVTHWKPLPNAKQK